MALKFEDAFAKIKTLAGSPCQVDVSDEELWGLQGGVLLAIVFHWPTVPQTAREPFLKLLFGERVTRPYLMRDEEELQLANKDIVPFAVLGRAALHTEGTTLEKRLDSEVAGALFFDLVHGNLGACPILLWDLQRFGKVASEVSKLGLRLGTGGPVSHVVLSMPQRTFLLEAGAELRFWQIEVKGRRVKMQRGLLKADNQKDWPSNEIKEADFPSSAEAKKRADELVQKYLGQGYLEQPGFTG